MAAAPLHILFEGEGYIAIDKPAGSLVIPGRGADEAPSLAGNNFKTSSDAGFFVVHRLDLHTSGALLFALTAEAHRALSMAFEGGLVRKVYQALVAGIMEAPQRVEVPLAPARRGRMRPAKQGEGKAALTVVRPVEPLFGATFVDVEPLTGRTHQIRVHLAAIGHPLLVDPQYGRSEALTERALGGASDAEVLSRTPLHAVSIEVPKLDGIAPARIESPLAGDIQRALELLRRS